MISQISNGIKVSVEVFYQPENSFPEQDNFMFAYRITIENNNHFSVQLLQRHWFIFDSLAPASEVMGDGVIGMQPIIQPSEKYQYMSGCNLRSEMGRMHGYFFMQNCYNKNYFKTYIPEFELIAPFKWN